MKASELRKQRKEFLDTYYPYRFQHWQNFYYEMLRNIMYIGRAGRGERATYNDAVIMIDTETSKEHPNRYRQIRHKNGCIEEKVIPVDNYVVAWTVTIGAYGRLICTLWGHDPEELTACIKRMIDVMSGDRTIFYVHNLSYDWVFLRRFFLNKWGAPVKQLNTKSHYPIYIEFDNGLILRDSLILAQRSLEKWAADLDVKHQKAVGKWDYDRIRTQKETYTPDELTYIENDTCAGVECIQKTMEVLGKRIYSMPYTATGIPREAVRKLGKAENAHDRFMSMALDYAQYMIVSEHVFHGGYTHSNRYYIEETIRGLIECYDFASSYPFSMLAFKYPMEKFSPLQDTSVFKILEKKETHAFYFKFIATNIELKDYYDPMPALQLSKMVEIQDPIVDNGRVLQASYVEIWLTEADAEVIADRYVWDKHICTGIQFAQKDYLPRWFTDYIYQMFVEKTRFKGGDPVLYSIKKAIVNSCYGMTVQKPLRDNMIEDYETGDFYREIEGDPEAAYNKYVRRFSSVLPYQWGVWVTSYAFRNLFKLGDCAGIWYYSDTDSCYGADWDHEKIAEYNKWCKDLLTERGYTGVLHQGKEYWLGVAELDGQYTEFRTLGAKRYCVRKKEDGKLKITVAGVPKKGVKCLNDNINNFTAGWIFSGSETGKMTHHYIYHEDVWRDKRGNLCADSVDLTRADYLMDSVTVPDWTKLFVEEVNIQVYEEE